MLNKFRQLSDTKQGLVVGGTLGLLVLGVLLLIKLIA
jgi:hypothetical protein